MPDLIILDLLMPDVDGFAVLEWMSEARGVGQIPVVVLTSSENPEHEGRSLELGAKAFYKKPADLDELGAVVKKIVEEWIPATADSAG